MQSDQDPVCNTDSVSNTLINSSTVTVLYFSIVYLNSKIWLIEIKLFHL